MKFYHIQPSEYWRLTPPQFHVLADYMDRYQKAEEKAAREAGL
jgi:hypothetical protein